MSLFNNTSPERIDIKTTFSEIIDVYKETTFISITEIVKRDNAKINESWIATCILPDGKYDGQHKTIIASKIVNKTFLVIKSSCYGTTFICKNDRSSITLIWDQNEKQWCLLNENGMHDVYNEQSLQAYISSPF